MANNKTAMTEAEIQDLQKKLEITDVATKVYVEQNGSFTLHDIAKQLDMTVRDIFEYFPDKQAILNFFYTSLIIRYELMISEIQDFKTFTLSEKLSNFAYTSMDLLDERANFVQATFEPHILHTCRKTDYEKRIESLLSDFIKEDSMIPASSEFLLNDTAISLMRRQYLKLILFWLQDKSEGKEVSMELVDKATGLIQEALYTSVVDRGIELAKFLYANNVITQHLPFWERITSSFDIH